MRDAYQTVRAPHVFHLVTGGADVLQQQLSAVSRPSPEHVLTVVSALSGIPLDALQSPSQLRRLRPARAAAAYLLRVDGGLSVKEILASRQTGRPWSAPARGRAPSAQGGRDDLQTEDGSSTAWIP